MRTTLFAAALAVSTSAGTASAVTQVLTFTITNDTFVPYQTVTFELRQPLGVQQSPESFALMNFVLDSSRHTSTKAPVTVVIDESNMKRVTFDYSNFSPLSRDDGQVSFTVTIDNPLGEAFRIGIIKTSIPGPAAGLAMVGFAGAVAARRRRAA